jgi:hypothetical protein
VAYQRKIWANGDQPTAAALNNIEAGITGAETQDAAIRTTISGIETRIGQDEVDIVGESEEALGFSDDLTSIQNTRRETQNICNAKSAQTGSGTTFDIYSVVYQPFVNLIAYDSVAKGLKCLVAGTYLVMVDVWLKNTDVTLNMRKNGSTVEDVVRLQTNKTTVIAQRVTGYSLVTLAVNDILNFAVSRSTSLYNTGYDLNIILYKIA